MLKEIKVYNELSVDDIEKFESGLIEWSEIEGQNSNMIFEESSLEKIRTKMNENLGIRYGIIISDNYRTKKMETPSLTIIWNPLNENKGVLKKVIFNQTMEVLYSATEGWKDTVLWYGC